MYQPVEAQKGGSLQRLGAESHRKYVIMRVSNAQLDVDLAKDVCDLRKETRDHLRGYNETMRDLRRELVDIKKCKTELDKKDKQETMRQIENIRVCAHAHAHYNDVMAQHARAVLPGNQRTLLKKKDFEQLDSMLRRHETETTKSKHGTDS